MSKEKKNKNLKFDLASGLVVFFVALPLCLGISLASTSYSGQEGLADFGGVIFPGIIAGVIGGIIVGFFSGSRYGVSGPAAGLITIIAAAIVSLGGFENGGYEKFALAVMLAGVLQIIFGFLKGGFIAYYIPFSVIKGMLAGIGITIFLKELPHFFGYDSDVEGDLEFFQRDGENTFSELWKMTDNVHWGATLIAIVSLLILILWGSKKIKASKVLNMIPGPLLAIVISILLVTLFASIPSLLIESEHLVSVPTPSNFEEFKGQLMFPDFSAITDYKVYSIALVIAIVASIESLLCVEATDKMDPHKGRTPMNKELKAQGIGNVISGLIGGLPITQVIVRSSANMSAGAKSKNSAIIHGVFLLVFVIAIPGVLNMIPRATLAAILLLIGYKLASPVAIKSMIRSGWNQYVPFFVTIIVMLFTDLLVGVGSGLIVAFLIILYRNYKTAYFIDPNQKKDEPIRLTLSQHATFLNKANIMQTFDDIADGNDVIIDLSQNIDIDYDIIEAIKDFRESCVDRNIKLEIIADEKLNQITVAH
ncbi:MAG: MFS superfamily sulfate permease-like transporter [Crocinitomix sp.]|jgi:MFS superfamily sulfate permease-like transporter